MMTLPHKTLIGWFALAFSEDITENTSKTGVFFEIPYTLSRNHQSLHCTADILFLSEQNGVIYAWHHPQQLPPSWHIPVLEETHWSRFLKHTLKVRVHPQEVYENSVDLSHFPMVHHFKGVRHVQDPIFHQHTMSIHHAIERPNPQTLGLTRLKASFEVKLHGLGCAHNHIDVPAYDMRVRMFALTTPITATTSEIRLAVSILYDRKTLFNRLFSKIIHRSIFKNILHDFSQDIPVWENKHYLEKPLLVKADGKIMQFRHWCQQFYGEKQ